MKKRMTSSEKHIRRMDEKRTLKKKTNNINNLVVYKNITKRGFILGSHKKIGCLSKIEDE